MGGTRTHEMLITRQSTLPTELPGQLSRQGSRSTTQHKTPSHCARWHRNPSYVCTHNTWIHFSREKFNHYHLSLVRPRYEDRVLGGGAVVPDVGTGEEAGEAGEVGEGSSDEEGDDEEPIYDQPDEGDE